MKKTMMVLLLTTTAASAQVYKPFKVNASVGFAIPTASYNQANPVGPAFSIFSLEPRYALSDRFDVGLRAEVVDLRRTVSVIFPNGSGGSSDGDGTNGSVLLTGTYFMGTSARLRPYVGLGAGIARVSTTIVRDIGTIVNGTRDSRITVEDQPYSRVGALARVGAKIGHLNLAAEYNFVSPTAYVVNKGLNAQNNNSYVGLKAGFDIGGGRR